MRILLINPIAREWAEPNVFPTGIGYIASLLCDLGHDVIIRDQNANRGQHTTIFPAPDLIGITGIITQYAAVKQIAEKCRDTYPKIPIICGGPLASSVPDLLLDKTEVNICVVGEGEEIMAELVDILKWRTNNIQYLSKWKQIISKKEVIKDLSTILFPAYNFFPMETYIRNPIGPFNKNKWIDGKSVNPNPLRTINMIGSRGCAYNCSFCFHCYMGQGFRLRSAQDILREMWILISRYKVDYIQFTDDAFASNKKFMIDFCGQKIDSDLTGVPEIRWSCAGRANIIDEEMYQAMKRSNCIGVWYGLESGSQKILDILNKKVTLKQYRKVIELNKKYFPFEDYSFIVGSPMEDKGTVQESIKFCKEMEINPSAIFYMTPYPGTPLYEQLKITDKAFAMATSPKFLEKFVLSLGEQGEKIAWNCTGGSLTDKELIELHGRFIDETDALNKSICRS